MSEPSRRRLLLVFHGRYPSEKAASLFAAKNAEAFADVGEEVVLLAPTLRRSAADSFAYFDVRRNFRVRYLPTINLFPLGLDRAAFYVSYLCFSASCLAYLAAASRRGDVVYSNALLPLVSARLLGRTAIFEMHTGFPERRVRMHGWGFRRMRGIVAPNRWLVEQTQSTLGVPPARLLQETGAVDPAPFDAGPTRDEARRRLDIDPRIKMVLYTGHLYAWKGVDTLAEAAGRLPAGVQVYVVGGTAADLQRFRAAFGSVTSLVIVGHRPHAEMPTWQAAADVLVLPNTEREPISKYYTSPMKLFEYLASGRPIVATDVPSIRAIVSDEAVLFCHPDDPVDMAGAIARVLEDPRRAAALSDAARALGRQFTWQARARRIVAFIDRMQS